MPICDCIMNHTQDYKAVTGDFQEVIYCSAKTAAQWRQVTIDMQFSLPWHSAPHTDLLVASHFTCGEEQDVEQNQLFFN